MDFFDHAELDLMCQEYFGVLPGIAFHCFRFPGLLCALGGEGWAAGGDSGGAVSSGFSDGIWLLL